GWVIGSATSLIAAEITPLDWIRLPVAIIGALAALLTFPLFLFEWLRVTERVGIEVDSPYIGIAHTLWLIGWGVGFMGCASIQFDLLQGV
ncbi:MAG: hypothetical protein KDA30_08330, partial [Phycisphaerales bacterium]|nr:hypothetical protein [Phycisphaerales bacterium]